MIEGNEKPNDERLGKNVLKFVHDIKTQANEDNYG